MASSATFDGVDHRAPGCAHRGRLARVDHHGGAGLLDHQIDPLDVIVVGVRDQHRADLEAPPAGLVQQPIDLPGRVDDGRLVRLGAVEDLAEVLQQPDLHLDHLGRRRQTGGVVRSGAGLVAHFDPTRTVTDAAPTLSALSQARTATA